jgi:hypothetical protein
MDLVSRLDASKIHPCGLTRQIQISRTTVPAAELGHRCAGHHKSSAIHCMCQLLCHMLSFPKDRSLTVSIENVSSSVSILYCFQTFLPFAVDMVTETDTTTPSPISFSPSQDWDGMDGQWSSFIVRVGTPEQNFRVFPAPAMGETIVPIDDGCNGPKDLPDCGKLRGVSTFKGMPSGGLQVNESSTWSEIGIYHLDLKPDLGFTGKGLYGLDHMGLMVQNSGGPYMENAVVAAVKTKVIWNGLFGLSPKGSNFSEFSNPQPSYMTNLKNKNMIPSLSFGYTAGAYYSESKVSSTYSCADTRYHSENCSLCYCIFQSWYD